MLPSTAVTDNTPTAVRASHGDPKTPQAAGTVADEGQYSLSQILMTWAAAAIPMAVLAWVVAPAVGDRLDLGVGDENREAFTRAGFITLGLI